MSPTARGAQLVSTADEAVDQSRMRLFSGIDDAEDTFLLESLTRLPSNATEGTAKLGNYMRKCASGGQSLANAERGVSMCGFAGKIDTEFFITNVLLCIIIGNPGPNILVAHFRM